jgi:hypothetical protein
MLANGQRVSPRQYDESGGENSDVGHDRFRDGHGGGRWAGHCGRDGGWAHGCGCDYHVHFEDEEFNDNDHEKGFDDDEILFANDGLFERC